MILEVLRSIRTLFFHYEKCFQDHCGERAGRSTWDGGEIGRGSDNPVSCCYPGKAPALRARLGYRPGMGRAAGRQPDCWRAKPQLRILVASWKPVKGLVAGEPRTTPIRVRPLRTASKSSVWAA